MVVSIFKLVGVVHRSVYGKSQIIFIVSNKFFELLTSHI